MKKIVGAVLRNAEGERLFDITEDELPHYQALAEAGQIQRFKQTKRGKAFLIFKLKDAPLPDILYPKPSNSHDTSCSLTRHDSLGLAGMNFPDSKINRFQIERWAGYGLLDPAHA